MSPFDNSHIGFPLRLWDSPIDPGAEPVGMERAVKHLKTQIGDPGSPGTDSHDQNLFLLLVASRGSCTRFQKRASADTDPLL
jgi:hypothetical protein